ncbi:hypothetical protein BCR44DRAFT_44382 [Catenaria anguillulae PL171]|uniref:Uncharacterized protein n=1 Tax=Catenaria anguillulae PL171 TaxID=765915 RepID=A0A1Y2HHC7_9FUNG|nr:hypothetical protein BCR44DRAFT_44382 [Catenaria anguillulae PL171]
MYTNNSMSHATSPIPHTSPQNVSASMSRASKGLRSLLSPGGRSSSVRNLLSTTPSPPPLHSNGIYPPPQPYGYSHNPHGNGLHAGIPTPMRNAGAGMYGNSHHQGMHHHHRPHGMHHSDSGAALSMDSMATMTPMGPSDIAPHIRIARLESQLARAWDEITTNRAALRRLDTQGLVPPMPPLDGFVEDEIGESGYFNGSNPGSFYHGRSGRYGPDGQYLGAQGGMLSGMQGWLVVAIMGVVGMVIGLLMRSG